MKDVLLNKTIKLNTRRKNRKAWDRIVRTMAMVVVFCTTYALILPAITMHAEPVCGIQEHTHSQSCYSGSLQCSLPEDAKILHLHDESCTDEQGTLICTLPEATEHSHEESCYTTSDRLVCPVTHVHSEECTLKETQLTCTLEEAEGHVHSESCALTQQVLICTLEEQEPHTHGEGCYALQPQTCELPEDETHTHSEDCTAPVSVLTCTLQETEGHAHGEACYEMQTVPCEITETEGHTHSESCYTEIITPCTEPDAQSHVHDESCTQSVTELTCGKEEIRLHTHEAACYDEAGALVCTQPQVVVHTHSEACQAPEEQILICTLPEHTHEDSCYPQEEEASASLEYLCGYALHSHLEACYNAEGTLTCTIPEHRHEAACVLEDLDLTADVETAEQWEAALAELELTGVWREDVLTIAESQLDYEESKKNVILEGETLKGYTRYGARYGEPYIDWSAAFVVFCLDDTGVEDFPASTDGTAWVKALEENSLFIPAGEYIPQPGDLVFFGTDLRAEPEGALTVDAVGIAAEWIPADGETPASIKTIQGDVNGKVAYVTWEQADPAILGFAILPEPALLCGREEHTHTMACMDEGMNLICGLTEHSHDDQCRLTQEGPAEEQPSQEPALVCTLSEHTHEQTCFDPETGELICTLLEHTHTPECGLQEEMPAPGAGLPLVCTLAEHTHAEACTDPETGELTCEICEHIHTAQCYGPAEAVFAYEDDAVHMEVAVASPTALPEGLAMTVTALDADGQTWTSYEDYAYANAQGELFRFGGYQLHFYVDGNEVELPDAEVTVRLTILPVKYEAPAARTFSLRSLFTSNEDTGEEPEDKTVVVTVLQENAGEVVPGGTATFTGDSSEGSVVTLKLGASRTVALASEIAPTFRVEFYANMPHYVWDHSGNNGAYPASLDIIDTTGNGDGTGGYLPQVGSATDPIPSHSNSVLYLYLEAYANQDKEGNNITTYRPAQEYRLTEVYTADSRTYVPAMSVNYLNKLKDNHRYALEKVWVSQDGGSSFKSYGMSLEADDEVDVSVNDIHSITFTNNASSASDADGVILITSDTVIRFEYHVIQDFYSNAANFYDYDISTGVVSDASGRTYASVNAAKAAGVTQFYMQTNQKGINTSGNYVSSGSKLAFGNANTNMGLDKVKASNGMYLNQYNSTGRGSLNAFKGCAFGIVSGYDYDSKTLIYANGINHQNLFNESNAVTGKTPYGGQMLNFERVGDHYTLVAVNGGRSAGNVGEYRLNEFFNPGDHSSSNGTIHTHIFTNNFWPMDNVVTDSTTGHDFKFGDKNSYDNYLRNYTNGSGTASHLPPSDDFIPHNSYFGMQYAVGFSIDGQYCGPLEYLFYGDDDMWVFLTDHQTGKTQLICDIGGVHSSVGSYTDLWDYIKKGEAGKGDYTLSFFYLERGASGSSCYMAFTLPGVTSIPQDIPDAGTLTVHKDAIADPDAAAAYSFRLDLSGTGSGDRYTYMISGSAQDRSGSLVSGDTFTLAADETITVLGLPAGMQYTLSELFAAGQTGAYDVQWKNGDGSTVSGTILSNKVVTGGTTETILCTNTAVGALEIEKILTGTETDQAFQMAVTLTGADGAPVSGKFGAYTFDAEGKATIALRPGDKATIPSLPVGTAFAVAEQDHEGYDVRYRIDGAEAEAATGTIGHNTTVLVTVQNLTQYKLPNTGGLGTSFFTFGGLLVLAVAFMYCSKIGRKQRKGGA